MKNIDVKNYATKRGVKLWEVAERMNIFDSSLSRKMRKELSQEEKDEIKRIIDEIAKERLD